VHGRDNVVGGTAEGADEARVADDVGVEVHRAADHVLERYVGVLGDAEADDRALARVETAARLVGRNAAAGAAILRRTARREILAAAVLEPLRRAEAAVRVAAGQ